MSCEMTTTRCATTTRASAVARAIARGGSWRREDKARGRSTAATRLARRDADARRGVEVVRRGFLSDWLAKNDDKGSKGKASAGGKKKKSATPSERRRPAPKVADTIDSPFDDFTNEELKPDFGFRRDLHELYDVPSLDEEPLGAGSYGVVRKATSKKTGEAFALKTLKKAPWKTAPASKAAVQYYHGKLRNEVEVMQTIGASLSVVYLYDAFEDDECVHLLMELCSGGELLDRISMNDSNDYREQKAAQLVKSVLRTAVQCHSRGIIYRDIKPDNFLFQTEDDDSPLKATDFGLAGKLPPKGEVLARRCGTPSYMAPEVIERNYGSQADVWSAGVVAYQLLSGRLPFIDKVNARPNAKEVFRAILEDEVDLESDPWSQVSDEAKDFVRKLLDRDPEARPTARAALLHPWLTQTSASWKAKAAKGQDSALDGQVVARLQRFATQGLLKRSVLRLIARELLSEDEDDIKTLSQARDADIETLKALFAKLDTSGDNMVELGELEVGLREIGYDVTGRESKQLLGSLDTSGDGLIDVNEFIAALLDWEKIEQTSEYPKWVERAFNILDKDNSGQIDAEEVAQLIFEESSESNDSVRAAIVKACIREADIDGNGKIDMDEFASLLQADPTDDLDQYDSREISASSSFDKD